MFASSRALLASLALALVGCSAAPPPSPTPTPPGSAMQKTPPRTGWFRYPATRAPDLPSQRITQSQSVGRRCVVITNEGHRLLAPSCATETLVKGPVGVALHRLPPLASFVATADGVSFITELGQVFHGAAPLAEATEVVPDGRKRRAIAGAPIAIDADGHLDRFDGARWQRVAFPNEVTIDDAIVAASADADGGVIVALGIPESLWESTDRGATFHAAASQRSEPIGAHALALEASTNTIFVRGSNGRLARGPQRRYFEDAASPPGDDAKDLELGVWPRSTLVGFSAAIDGDRFVELRTLSRFERAWGLTQGKLGQPLTTRPLPELATCIDGSIAARGRTIAIACATDGMPHGSATLWGSTDGGATFHDWGHLDGPPTQWWLLAVPEEGVVLVANTQQASISVRLASGVFTETETPKARAIALHDDPTDPNIALIGLDDTGLRVSVARLTQHGLDVTRTMAPFPDQHFTDLCSRPAFDRDGVLGLCARVGEEPHWLTMRPQSPWIDRTLPMTARGVGGAGAHVIITGNDALQISGDGGATFTPLARDVGQTSGVACNADACVLDEGLVLLGWDATHAPVLESIARNEAPPPPPTLSPPIVCAIARGKHELIEDLEARFQPFPQLDRMGTRDALFDVTTAGKSFRTRVVASPDGSALRRVTAAPNAPHAAPRWPIGPSFTPPGFARRSTETHALRDGSLAESELVTFYEGSALGDRYVVTYAWRDASSGDTRASTLTARTQATFTRRGDELGVLFAPFRWGAPDASWDAPYYRPVREDGSLGAPIQEPSIDAFARELPSCSSAARATTPRAIFAYGGPVSGGGRTPVVLSEPGEPDRFGLADGGVLYGTRDAPCGAAVRASGVDSSWVAVLDGSTRRGFLLREVRPPLTSTRKSLRVDKLTCHREARPVPSALSERAQVASSTTRTSPPGKL
jgi:hypothetical protein